MVTMWISTSRNDCTLRVHLPYGYNVQLGVHLLTGDDSTRSDNAETSSEVGVVNEEWLLQNGRCLVAVEAEDVSGRQTTCLRERHAKATFSSASNVLDFQIIFLQAASQGTRRRNSLRARRSRSAARPWSWFRHPCLPHFLNNVLIFHIFNYKYYHSIELSTMILTPR